MRRFVFLVVNLLLSACSQNISEANTAVSPPDAITIDIEAVPTLDTGSATVPLGEIYFDTFRATNRAVPLDEADDALIMRLRDAIPPLYNPRFEAADSADRWLSGSHRVIGYADGNEAFAYPLNILNYHEIVRQTVNGRPILVTYCPLCQSGVVYDPSVDGKTLIFGNTSALYESDMVMLDHQTGSFWVQVSGEAVVGPLAGTRLAPLPSQTTGWALWFEQHPNTLVLSRDTGFDRPYTRDPFASYAEQLNTAGSFAFPVSDAGRDRRLAPGDRVLGVEMDGTVRVYPLDKVRDGVVNDAVGENAIAIFVREESGTAYRAELDGSPLTFTFERNRFFDAETGSEWTFGGTAVSGELSGSRLEPLPSRTTLWFSMIASYPELELVEP